ncbi:hypothetical protein A8L34_16285 [Bacillus sp. FJAT-27264]|nr:hypothetical protein A8L34_16285 [Bacillus sp. FJAT-27264]
MGGELESVSIKQSDKGNESIIFSQMGRSRQNAEVKKQKLLNKISESAMARRTPVHTPSWLSRLIARLKWNLWGGW